MVCSSHSVNTLWEKCFCQRWKGSSFFRIDLSFLVSIVHQLPLYLYIPPWWDNDQCTAPIHPGFANNNLISSVFCRSNKKSWPGVPPRTCPASTGTRGIPCSSRRDSSRRQTYSRISSSSTSSPSIRTWDHFRYSHYPSGKLATKFNNTLVGLSESNGAGHPQVLRSLPTRPLRLLLR